MISNLYLQQAKNKNELEKLQKNRKICIKRQYDLKCKEIVEMENHIQ